MAGPIESKKDKPDSPKPMMMVGAGPLTSAIWKTGDEHTGWRYRRTWVNLTNWIKSAG
jgi:hypothetical protein